MSQAKRPSKFDMGSSSAKAPDNYKTKNNKVIKEISVVPSRPTDGIFLEDSSPIIEKISISTLPSSYRDSFVEVEPQPVLEKNNKFVYKVPDGYVSKKPPVVKEEVLEQRVDYVVQLENELKKLKNISYKSIDVLMKSICREYNISPQKLHTEFVAKHKLIPDEWVKENSDIPAVRQQHKEEMQQKGIELLASKMPILPQNATQPVINEEISNRLLFLEKQMISLRQVSIEQQQGTIVHGLGHQSPGSGEVNLSKMDDVVMDAVQDGDHLIWDSTLGKWIPSGAIDGGSGTNGSILLRLFLLEEKLHSIEEILHEHVDEGDGHENHVGEMVEYESGTDRTFAQEVNFTDHTKAYIALEEALQGDHFHFAAPLTDLIIRVEDGTQFVIPTPEDHLPVLVEPEINSDYYGVARPIDFQDTNLKLLAFEEANQHQVFAAEGELIFELEDNTPLFLPSGELHGFSVDDETDLTNSNVIDWGSDVTLLNQEGAHFSPSVLEPQEGNFVQLEQEHTTTGYNYDPDAQYDFEKFFDFEADGDTTIFTVTQDTVRNVYQLDGIPQPTVQLPRGDIIGFDIRNLEDKDSFTIFADGEEVSEPAVVRILEDNLVMVYTGQLSNDVSKLYYRHRTLRGLGWVIVVTDN